MVRHLLTTAIIMAPGLAILFVVWKRYGEGRRTLRRFAIAYPVMLLLIAGVSAGSEVYRERCPDNPLEWCEYNDSVPAMAGIAIVYLIAAAIRGWMLYAER